MKIFLTIAIWKKKKWKEFEPSTSTACAGSTLIKPVAYIIIFYFKQSLTIGTSILLKSTNFPQFYFQHCFKSKVIEDCNQGRSKIAASQLKYKLRKKVRTNQCKKLATCRTCNLCKYINRTILYDPCLTCWLPPIQQTYDTKEVLTGRNINGNGFDKQPIS